MSAQPRFTQMTMVTAKRTSSLLPANTPACAASSTSSPATISTPDPAAATSARRPGPTCREALQAV